MSYISFDKQQLVNLEYSLGKELLRTNRAGSYASTTIIRCNTRKYHGLLISRQPQIDDLHHVFLSTLDVTVIQNEAEFNLGIHKYKDNLYEPGGHKYIRDFESDPIPKLTYRVGGVVLTSEMIFSQDEHQILMRYTLQDAHSPTKLRFRPLLAFRNIHSLSQKNDGVDYTFKEVHNGIRLKMYPQYDYLNLQFSRKVGYQHKPYWYFNVEYTKEKNRGYAYKEDLYSPGFFEVNIKKGDSIVFAAGLEDAGNIRFNHLFNKEISYRIPRNNFVNCLVNAAEQFFMNDNGNTDLIAGYHWFDVHGRDTFIALPGLTLTRNNTTDFFRVMDTMIGKLKGVLFPSTIHGKNIEYNSVDASLWFFWALQQYIGFTGDGEIIWTKYGSVMRKILEGYKKGTDHNIHMLDSGLLYAGYENDTLTWMNTRLNDRPVIHRNGLAVEVNALWYNAIHFYTDLATENKYSYGVKAWREILEQIEISFSETFWDEKQGYLADVVRGDFRDMTVRPNQLFAASLPHSPVTDDIKYLVLHKVQQELLTPRGIRTLSPKDPDYSGIYRGDIFARDNAYHKGSAFPWLFGHFAEGYLNLHGKSGLALIKRYVYDFEKEMTEAGIGTISELFYGDPPHKGKGAISHAWSVSELLRTIHLIQKLEQNTNHDR